MYLAGFWHYVLILHHLLLMWHTALSIKGMDHDKDAFDENRDSSWLSGKLASIQKCTTIHINHRRVRQIYIKNMHKWTQVHSCMHRHTKACFKTATVILLSLLCTYTNILTSLCLCWLCSHDCSQAWLEVMLVISCKQRKFDTLQLMWPTGRFLSSHMTQSKANYK